MKVLEQLMTKTMTNHCDEYLCRDFFCRLHFSLAVIVPDIYIYIEFTASAIMQSIWRSYIIVCSEVRSTIEGVKTCFRLSFSGVFEYPGVN